MNLRPTQIESITATYEEDRENMIGVVRCTGITIEASDADPNDVMEDQDEIYNALADVEYFTEDENWQEDAASDVAGKAGVSDSKVVVE